VSRGSAFHKGRVLVSCRTYEECTMSQDNSVLAIWIRDTPVGPQARSSLLSSAVHLALQALDEVLGTSVLPFGETLPDLIYHHTRRAVLLKPAE
jgi:hypothetical protein